MFFNLKIALKFLFQNKLQNILIFLTIIIGIAVQFFVISLSSVLNNIIIDNTTLYINHITFHAKTNKYLSYDELDFELLREIEKVDNVDTLLITEVLYGLIYKDENYQVPFYLRITSDLNGNEQAHFNFYGTGLDINKVSGNINKPLEGEIMLNDSFAKEHNFEIGDEITFYNNFLNQYFYYTITGTYDTGQFEYLSNNTYVEYNMNNLNRKLWFRYQIKLKDPSLVLETLEEIENILDKDLYNISSFYNSTQKFNTLNIAQRAVIGVIQLLIAFTIFVIITNVLNFIIQTKYYEIGILKAMGHSNKNLRNIFIYLTTIIAAVASLIGLSIGSLAFYIYSKVMKDPYYQKPRFEYQFNYQSFVYLFIAMIVLSLLASIYAFYKTSKVSIVELIKSR